VREKDDDLVKTVTASLLDQLALFHQHAGAMSSANLRLPFQQESGRGLAADSYPDSDLHTTLAMTDKFSRNTDADRSQARTIDAAADGPRSRGFALLNAAAVRGRLSCSPSSCRRFSTISLKRLVVDHCRRISPLNHRAAPLMTQRPSNRRLC
jgi:hypothetical protein